MESIDEQVVMMNSALYALERFQTAMQGEAELAGLYSEEDVVDMIHAMRANEKKWIDPIMPPLISVIPAIPGPESNTL